MKKNLKNGFTLVELIVVMSLMGIIMGGVLMMMKPANNLFNKVSYTKDEEEICVTVGDNISNEIRYATGLAIYVCDPSDPIPAAPTTEYKNFIEIDNHNPRSASKKGATGIVIKGTISGGTLTGSPFISDDYFGEDYYNIQVAQTNSTASSEFLMFDFEASPMTYNGTAYVRNSDQIYNYSKSIELVNLNNSTLIKATTSGFVYSDTSTSTDNIIYIYYVKPSNATTATTTAGSGTTTTTTATTVAGGTTATMAGGGTTVATTNATVVSQASVTTTATTTTPATTTTTTTTTSTPVEAGEVRFLLKSNSTNCSKILLYTLNSERKINNQYEYSATSDIQEVTLSLTSDDKYLYFNSVDTNNNLYVYHGKGSYNYTWIDGDLNTNGYRLDTSSISGSTIYCLDGVLYNYLPNGWYTQSIKINYSSNNSYTVNIYVNQWYSYDQTYIYKFSVKDTNGEYTNLTSAGTYVVSNGNNLSVTVVKTMNNNTVETSSEQVFSYGEISGDEIWISNGKIYTYQPDDWV